MILGRNTVAYKDNDTANYRYTPRVHTEGNRGFTYRNDGVDIKNDDKKEPYVFSIEDGEWLLYTINVAYRGNYHLTFYTSGNEGVMDLYDNDHLVAENIAISASNNDNDFVQTTSVPIHLIKEVNKIKIYFKKGGFNFKSFVLTKEK